MDSKIDNGHCFGPATVSSRKKKTHAESNQIDHPSAARSSETRLQMSGKMLGAIEEVCLFCAMCLVRVGRVIRAAEDGDSPNATVFTELSQMAASKQHSRSPPHVASAGPNIPHAVLYRSVLMVQALERFHQLFRCSVQIPEWRPHISSPIIGLGVVRGFLNKSIVFWLAPPQNQTLLLRGPPKFLQQWHFTVLLQKLHGASTYGSDLSKSPSTKNSYIGCAASSCSASPDGGLHLWRSNSVVPTQCQHAPHGIFEWCRARVSGSSSQFL